MNPGVGCFSVALRTDFGVSSVGPLSWARASRMPRRELLEESGLRTRRLHRVDVYSGPEFRLTYPTGDQAFVVGVTFLAEGIEGSPAADGLEGIELAWFHLDRFPELNGYNALLVQRVLASGQRADR